ncbi:MAG: alanine racemase [Clostridiales bacterium]|nr:alanine racemase [Clostridiales bacterium]
MERHRKKGFGGMDAETCITIRRMKDMNVQAAMSRTWMEVDVDALLHNYRLAKSLCHEGVDLICVLKANAYGLGLKSVGKFLYEEGARSFAVATADEALALREALPEGSILVMGPAAECRIAELIESRITLTCGTAENARMISHVAVQMGVCAQVQIKIDTGLHRLGFTDTEEIVQAMTLPGMRFTGLYSHLALRSDEQSAGQYEAFCRIEKQLKDRGVTFEHRHLLDSIGLVWYPDWQLTGVRVGAFLYGNVPPSWERFSESRETVRLCTRVTRVDWVEKGEGIGYDEEPIPERLRVATLAAGYIDGYSRLLSGKGEVILCGKRCKVLGLVCMDQMMVDVTHVPEVREGDVALLLGGGVTLREYAAWGGLNRNECTAVIGTRVPRVYLKDGIITRATDVFQD